VIVEAAKNKKTPMYTRLTGAAKGLEVLMKIHEHADVESQLRELVEEVTQMKMQWKGTLLP
jgi:hypothetical protein